MHGGKAGVVCESVRVFMPVCVCVRACVRAYACVMVQPEGVLASVSACVSLLVRIYHYVRISLAVFIYHLGQYPCTCKIGQFKLLCWI